MDDYYKERGWDLITTKPSAEKLRSLELEFVIKELK
jgi:aldehyde:ferredoxin oxidoreductase